MLKVVSGIICGMYELPYINTFPEFLAAARFFSLLTVFPSWLSFIWEFFEVQRRRKRISTIFFYESFL